MPTVAEQQRVADVGDTLHGAITVSHSGLSEASAHMLAETAARLLTLGKGILAADETPRTLGKRFEAFGIASTEETRRDYREMLFTTPGLAKYICGVILQDETIRQASPRGARLTSVVIDHGMLAGIKVDNGAKGLAGFPGEAITEGLDGLRERLTDYADLGARFAKWRAVFRVGDKMPSRGCIAANAHALARYAALCQEKNILPIVEPEVLMDGAHDLARCEDVTGEVLEAVFAALDEERVILEWMLLKPNMVIPGVDCPQSASIYEVAGATLRTLFRHVPAAVPGIVFLSGGQDAQLATIHLNAMNSLSTSKPWTLSFSYGRALQDVALATWLGEDRNLAPAQDALVRRARCNGAASRGMYSGGMEDQSPSAIDLSSAN